MKKKVYYKLNRYQVTEVEVETEKQEQAVKMLNRDYGITVVFITHYMDEAVKANRVLVMDDGNIILDGTAKQVFGHHDILKRVGLDIPEASQLASLLRKDGLKIKKDILDVDELYEEIVGILEDKI